MQELVEAFAYLMQPFPMFLLVMGTVLGIVVGAIPGLTGAMLISLTVPLTFGMNGMDALTLLVSMYVGSVSGGLITATLLRMPGTPASIMTTLDGYPMAQQGKPGRALGLGISASAIGGLISWMFLLMLARPLAAISTQLSSFDTFSLVMTALVLIASVSGTSVLVGIFSGMLGMFFSMPGTSPTGEIRLTAGFIELNDGFKLLPVLIGLYAISQIVQDVRKQDEPCESIELNRSGMFMNVNDWTTHWFNLLRSSLIGTWIGLLPGIGANVGSMVAYTAAKNSSKTPEQFGHGSEEGIVASEAANNATVGGALIPLIALGIPGSVIDAILLGALMIHDLQPGPLLFANNRLEVHAMIAAVLLANIVMAVFMVVFAGQFAKLVHIPKPILLPVILASCVIGSFALNNRGFDVAVMIFFGAFGCVMRRLNLPLAPFVIGFVLAPIAERKLCEGLMLSGGSYLPLLTHPLSCIFLIVAAVLLAVTLWKPKRDK